MKSQEKNTKEEDSGFTVRDLPESERPRERLMKQGARTLSEQELLAIILGRGIKGDSVIFSANKLLGSFKNLKNLSEATLEEIMNIRGFGKAKACQLIACFEVARRLYEKSEKKNESDSKIFEFQIKNPIDAVNVIKPQISDFKKEHFYILCLDIRNRVIGIDEVTKGTLTASLVHPRETFYIAIRKLAAQVMISHNHPSGDPEPSDEDIKITRRLVEAGKIMGIEVLDHIIITEDGFYSFKDKGLI